ncbi:MAG: M42 family metallopeptidase [candidate division NC10 bacterium]|nr:M42 family metallopeptidase [candidate division NC10 bacterium]
MWELLERLTSIPGGSGREQEIAYEMAAQMERLGAKVAIDPMGNVIGKARGGGKGGSIMICAHTDEVGMMVKYIHEEGFIYFDLNGLLDERALLATRVLVCSDRGNHPGVIGVKGRHLLSPEELQRAPSVFDLWIDVGARSRRQVERMGIRIGDPVVFQRNFQKLGNGFFTSPAIDDRAGCAILICLLERLRRAKLDYDLYVVATVQEEIGSRGAKVAAQRLQPDLALVIDTVPAADPATGRERATAKVEGGPVIRTMDVMPLMVGTVYSKNLHRHLLGLAEKKGIPYQLDIFRTWTDAASIHTTGTGIPTAGIYIPRRNSHSPAEVAHIRDIEDTLRLVLEFVKGLSPNLIEKLKTFG